MDAGWLKIIKMTGSVGVVALLLSILMNYFFNDKIVALLGSEMVFFIIVLISCGLLMALFLAIKNPKSESRTQSNETPTKDVKVNYGKNATHNGDNNF